MANPAIFKIIAEKVVEECPLGYKEGDEFEVVGMQTPNHRFCGGAYHALFPMLAALNFGTNFPWEPEPGTVHTTCPDLGKVTFKAIRVGYQNDLKGD